MVLAIRILLINPPFYRLMNSHFNGLSLGLCYIASILSKHGYDVTIFNGDFKKSQKYSTQKEIFDNYPQYNKILTDPGHELWQEIKNVIRDVNPSVIGISMLTGTYKSAQNIAVIAKQINPAINIIAGGTHPSICAQEVLASGLFDFVIRGEGEYTFLEILQGIPPGKISGLSYKKSDGRIIHNKDRNFIEDLDTLPFPARHLYVHEQNSMDFGYILTGRGCPFECTFCASKKIWKNHVRYRSPENVVDEINYVYHTFGTRFFYFIDDTFTLDKRRTEKILNLLSNLHLPIQWICDTRVNVLDENLLLLMKSAGCVRVKIGVESGSDRILQLIKKNITVNQIRTTVDLIKKTGLDVTIYLMAGFPSETKEDMLQTLAFAQELDPTYYSISIVTPYPGTEIYDEMLQSGKMPLKKWEFFYHQSRDMMILNNIDQDILNELLALNDRNGKVRL